VLVAPPLERFSSDISSAALRPLGMASEDPGRIDDSDSRSDRQPMMAQSARMMPSIDGDLVRSYPT
jgi:hypothetical protein